MADNPPNLPADSPEARLQLHRELHLHDAVNDDWREIWAAAHPDGAQPWDEP